MLTGQSQLHPGLEESEGNQNRYALITSVLSVEVQNDCVSMFLTAIHHLEKVYRVHVMEDRQKILRQQQLRQAANIDAFRDYTFKTFNYRIPGVQEAVRISLEYAFHPQGWLLLVGPCGCGKTHLAAAIANQCLENGVSVFFTTAPDFLDTLRAALVSPEQYTKLYTWVRR